jgi:alpha-galactosidase
MLQKRVMRAAVCAGLALAGVQLTGVAQASPTATSGDGRSLAVTPPMGWNDWAHYQCGVTEAIVEANAKALVDSGLAAKGYDTVTVDDCWMEKTRDANGNLVANPTTFPDGMAALGTYLHNLGLKFGIYEDAGYATCGGYAGSGTPNGGGSDHFTQDADLFASWGVDYLKLDGCNVYVPSGQTQLQAYQNAYSAETAALKASGRDIAFSESAPAYFMNTPDWYSVLGWVSQYGQLWREGWDIATYDSSNPTADRFYSVLDNYSYNNLLSRYAGPGDWNDPDFLIAGDSGMTDAESRSEIALWAVMSAPMILSSDVSALSSTAVAQLGNSDVIAVDQDSLGAQGTVISSNGTTDILVKPLANGDRAVALLNRGSSSETATTSASAIGFTGGSGCSYTVKDLWAGTSTSTTGAISATVASHDTAIFRVTPSTGCGATKQVGQIMSTHSSNASAATCVDDSGSGTADGNPTLVYSCTGNPNQQWTIGTDGTIRTLGKCLTAQNAGTAAGTAVVLSTCASSPSAAGQTWSYQSNGNLVNDNSGLCLDAYGGSTASGTKLDTWTCGYNQLNQIWSLPN